MSQFDFVEKVSLYEYLLAYAAMFKKNPEIVFKCLFKLFDSDHDDLLTKPELFELFNVVFDSEDNEGKKKAWMKSTNWSTRFLVIKKNYLKMNSVKPA